MLLHLLRMNKLFFCVCVLVWHTIFTNGVVTFITTWQKVQKPHSHILKARPKLCEGWGTWVLQHVCYEMDEPDVWCTGNALSCVVWTLITEPVLNYWISASQCCPLMDVKLGVLSASNS